MLMIEVVKIKGKRPVYKVGGKILIDGPKIDLEKTDDLCINALPSLLHYAVALEGGVDPVKLGLTTEKDPDDAYISNALTPEGHTLEEERLFLE
ncbi:MAG: TIGR04076 family protein [Thermotogota bacterium]|nr:TIGR04076 family protein [Thermotogota bacterium]